MVGQNSDAAASAVASALLEEEAAADAPRMRVEMVNFMIDVPKSSVVKCIPIFLTVGTTQRHVHKAQRNENGEGQKEYLTKSEVAYV